MRCHFSDSFKKQKIRDLEQWKIRVSETCKEYEVSGASVYRRIDKFVTQTKNKPERLIIEPKSDTENLLALRKEVAELERLIGQKRILIYFQGKIIELAEQRYRIDIK